MSAPEWLVFNAGVTVGPVRTDLLLRGVMHGRVPSSSLVRQIGWEHWRKVGQIREVSALQRVLERSVDQPALTPASLREGAEALAHASDAGEVLLIALHAAAHALSATVGLAHRVRAPLMLPTTSCLFDAPCERLGEVLPWTDPSFSLARSGCARAMPGYGRPGSVEHALAKRLSPHAPLHGVALLPILVGGKLHSMIELGRSDHSFRASDTAELFGFARQAAVALTRLAVGAQA